MIKRIVKMEFQLDKISEFKKLFSESKKTILSQEGCHSVELLQDINQENVFFTYSYWDSEDKLNQYRKTEFFNFVWKKTKKLFNNKPFAWSVQEIS
jgi:quinol monooxygenase YgiN